MKKIISSALTIILVGCTVLLMTSVSASISDTGAFAADTPSSSGMVLMSGPAALNVALNGSSGNQSNSFITSSSQPWYKARVENISSCKYIVTITKGSPTGVVQKSYEVNAGTQSTIRMDSTGGPGARYVNVTSSGGYPLQGTLSVSIASTEAELKRVMR
ncbi:MAG: hypothetical protein LBL35_01940 [Clostridiales bacterium]|nr:hypothetical protein [Clostridiales bacterium]